MGSGWLVAVAVVAGAAGVAVVCRHRRSLSRTLLLWRLRRQVRRCKKRIYVVTTEETWDSVLPILLREVSAGAALGMDCEWTVRGRKRQPVALLQLASHSGACVLVHLAAFTAPLPASLQSLLGDVCVVKAGVGILQDKRFLEADYGLQVEGCVDLRHLALCCPGPGDKAGPGSTVGLGLAALSLSHLGHTLDKDWRVRASNWQAEHLTQRQKSYAAEDALAGVQLLAVLSAKLWRPGQGRGGWLLPFLPPPFFLRHFSADTRDICRQYLDLKFSDSSKRVLPQGNGRVNQKQPPVLRKISQASQGYSPRQSPLYHNCQLLAPDDSLLCTCEPKKAMWYVERGLGVEVQHSPLVVRLNFEPAGRPRAGCQDEIFYVQERRNVCVVCGQEHACFRKNVVPQEYRKYFPSILKDHQSHDFVLLCMRCHRVSNAHDTVLRDTLARECDVPSVRRGSQTERTSAKRTAVRNAATALLKYRSTIPEARVRELEEVVKAYFTEDSISHELLEEAASVDGWRVCQAYMRKGLVELQQRWRRHFIDTMQPKHLPRFWSVTHNVQKMWEVMAGLSQDHPDFETYRLVLVGTDSADTITESTQ